MKHAGGTIIILLILSSVLFVSNVNTVMIETRYNNLNRHLEVFDIEMRNEKMNIINNNEIREFTYNYEGVRGSTFPIVESADESIYLYPEVISEEDESAVYEYDIQISPSIRYLDSHMYIPPNELGVSINHNTGEVQLEPKDDVYWCIMGTDSFTKYHTTKDRKFINSREDNDIFLKHNETVFVVDARNGTYTYIDNFLVSDYATSTISYSRQDNLYFISVQASNIDSFSVHPFPNSETFEVEFNGWFHSDPSSSFSDSGLRDLNFYKEYFSLEIITDMPPNIELHRKNIDTLSYEISTNNNEVGTITYFLRF